jgi:hypothetical protein
VAGTGAGVAGTGACVAGTGAGDGVCWGAGVVAGTGAGVTTGAIMSTAVFVGVFVGVSVGVSVGAVVSTMQSSQQEHSTSSQSTIISKDGTAHSCSGMTPVKALFWSLTWLKVFWSVAWLKVVGISTSDTGPENELFSNKREPSRGSRAISDGIVPVKSLR